MKTKVLKSNTKTRADLTVNGQNLEEVDSITYLGSEVDNLGGSDKKHNTICIGHHHTHNEDKTKNTIQYVLDTTIRKQKQIT